MQPVEPQQLPHASPPAGSPASATPATLPGPPVPSPATAPASTTPPAPPSPPVVELDRLTVALGGRPVLRGLSASLTGRCIGLLGPNGAGKTTLLHTLLGFHAPASGTARVLGRDILSEPAAIRAEMGYMPERDSFIAGLSGVRFVCLMAELSGLPAPAALERAHEALFFVGLGEARYRPVESYSLGMKQLAKLAQAIAHGPRLLFLDEPTNGLDPPARRRMLDLIRGIRDSGQARLILSSHLLRDVEECCEEVLVLKDGQVAVYANLDEERRANKRLLELEVRTADGAMAGPEFARMAAGIGCETAAGARHRLKLVLPEGVEVADMFRLAAGAQLQIRRLDYKRDSLEDIFLKAMEGDTDGRP